MPSVLAFYLPQFHQIPENDEWWGTGFTEWTTVRKAEKLYHGHNQPRVPLDKNYYNLLDKKTVMWQSNLMKTYGIDGVCMYHYWFKKGRRVLEKPAENLLIWKDIDMPYCFCWANETWARSWSKLQKKNVWADLYETEESGKNGILLEQEYGNREEWRQHFEYLLPFFKDERYIKINERPVFVIYKAADILCLKEMLEYWKELSELHGMQQVYIITSNFDMTGKDYIDAELYHEPLKTITNMPEESLHFYHGVGCWEYDAIWNYILKGSPCNKTYFSGVVGFDDTPRRGKNGREIIHSTPEKFQHYFTELMAKSKMYGNEIVFINAWNEWGEGMYLEPDELEGKRYLEAILYAKKHY